MSMYPIASQTVGAGGASSITFSSIPSTFTHLQVRILARSTTAGANAIYNFSAFNSDGGSNYSYHTLQGDGSSAFAGGYATQTNMQFRDLPGATATANAFGVAIVDILDYANTSKYKTLRYLGGYDVNGSGLVGIDSGLWQSTSAINTFTINTYSNFAQYSTFQLYGITTSNVTGA